jgi:hypothetical protein
MATPHPSTGAIGFQFEELITTTLKKLIPPMKALGWKARLFTEQDIRDVFNEQSLNGVDHMFEIEDASGAVTLFLLQEKWKFLTNQREVSQFLDCCARILSRISPEKRGKVYRLWVTRSQPSQNGDKSLLEGGAYTIQCMTSQPLLAQITGQFICELLGKRDLATTMIATMPSLLSTETPEEPAVLDESKKATLPALTYKTKVTVQKGDFYLGPDPNPTPK